MLSQQKLSTCTFHLFFPSFSASTQLEKVGGGEEGEGEKCVLSILAITMWVVHAKEEGEWRKV